MIGLRSAPRRERRWCVCAALGLVAMMAAPPPAGAQSRWSADLGFGAANVTGGNYSARFRWDLGGRIGYRAATVLGTDVVLGVSMQHVWTERAAVTVHPPGAPCPVWGCIFLPTAPDVPNFNYEAATLGIRRHVGSATLGLDGGLGSVDVSDAGRRLGVSGGADLGLQLGGSVRLVLRGEILSWTEGGNTLYAYPITIGLRVN